MLILTYRVDFKKHLDEIQITATNTLQRVESSYYSWLEQVAARIRVRVIVRA